MVAFLHEVKLRFLVEIENGLAHDFENEALCFYGLFAALETPTTTKRGLIRANSRTTFRLICSET